jgi:hypothetical protein
VLLTGAALVIVLGTIGFSQIEARDYSFSDSLYRAVTLFGFAGAVEANVPLELEIARVLAPLIVGYAAIRGLVLLFRDQAQLLHIRLVMRRHVVVAGLGRTGFKIAERFHEDNYRVVVIERDPTNPSISGGRDRGISVLKGDATDRRVLQKAMLHRSLYLLVATGDDRTDMDVLASSAPLAHAGRGEPLTAFVSLDDGLLWRALAARTLASPHGVSGLRQEFFHLPDLAADLLVEQHPPIPPVPREVPEPHVVMLGLEGVGESLALRLMRHWQVVRPGADLRIQVTLVEPRAVERRARLTDRYPLLESVCELHAVELEIDSAEVREASFLTSAAWASTAAVYVCLDAESDAAKTALSLASRPQVHDIPVVVVVQDVQAGVAAALAEGPPSVHPFGVLSTALTTHRMVEGVNETLARTMHDAYVRFERAKGLTSLDNELLVPWDALSAHVDPEKVQYAKDASRAFVDGIGPKLAKSGCTIVAAPLIDPDGPLVSFSPGEVEVLAMDEHKRWCAHKLADGWRHGPRKDTRAKTHPWLIPWDDLPEAEREKDREFVRSIPERLAQAEFEVLRLDRAAETPPPAPLTEPAKSPVSGVSAERS